MASKRFTAKGVEHMKPDPDKRREVPDPALPGLYLIIQPSGAKSWALRYRHSGKPKKMTLGRWPVMGLDYARTAATEALQRLEDGTDPNNAGQAEKRAIAAASETFAKVVEDYSARHLAKLKSGAHVTRELQRHAVARFGHRQLGEITRRDVLDLLEEIAATGKLTTANRQRAYLGRLFAWALERDMIESSPVAGTKPVARERPRERVLSHDEVRWFWRACERIGPPFGPMARLLLLTGQRLGEVVGMTKGELRSDLWHLPAERTKNRRAHEVPLSPAALEVLAEAPRIANASGLVFSTTGVTPLSGYSRARDRIAVEMERLAASEVGEPVEILHWSFHDLRRTAATGMARLGIPVRTTEAVLNHVSGTGGGIVGVYQRHDFAVEKRRALEAWAGLVAEIVEGGGAAKVVGLEVKQ
ncbi:tyrosine-type recombinase/integrase [Histidinibacterium aquaticum]|uniref:Tyrosine-type recombinase/integrase n=1 Tax=Histidinibacterium aquaticum TaxID=2613962 RepID=A0A5J5GMV7_9RHOB|nr:site-specific integrase [Histidinibacterium aquaticum]KAA9009696.1 tyrosine-type recombinase/integrase [Histidinibacterium aquaticum]